MSTRDTILAANANGTLLEVVVEMSYSDSESVMNLLSSLHNSGEIDFLAACDSDQLDNISRDSFFPLQRVFCEIFPNLCCSVSDATATCDKLFQKAGNDLTAPLVFKALREWMQESPGRALQGLAQLRLNIETQARLVRPVLLAGAVHNATKFAEEAFDLSYHPQTFARAEALWTLGRLVPEDNDQLLHRAIKRFADAIESPLTDSETAIAVEAALHLLERIGDGVAGDVERLLKRACQSPNPATRHALADGLQLHRSKYTDAMIDATFEALQQTNKHDSLTIKAIDHILYRWNIDEDRQRVLTLLMNLLSNEDDAIEIEALRDFRHRLGDEDGEVLGWYVVALLLTGNDQLGLAAARLLPVTKTPDRIDIDLTQFGLTSPWVLFLARKILGYCLMNQRCAAWLLLSCLRAVADQDRPAIENLILHCFLLNYLGAIDWFKSAVSPNDPAKESVNRLSNALESYVSELQRLGTCPAFAPSERERQLQGYHQADFWRKAQKKADEGSILSIVGRKATLLYGAASIAYVYKNEGTGPQRLEIAMAAHEVSVEFPRLHAIDPIGLSFATSGFRSERPPS